MLAPSRMEVLAMREIANFCVALPIGRGHPTTPLTDLAALRIANFSTT